MHSMFQAFLCFRLYIHLLKQHMLSLCSWYSADKDFVCGWSQYWRNTFFLCLMFCILFFLSWKWILLFSVLSFCLMWSFVRLWKLSYCHYFYFVTLFQLCPFQACNCYHKSQLQLNPYRIHILNYFNWSLVTYVFVLLHAMSISGLLVSHCEWQWLRIYPLLLGKCITSILAAFVGDALKKLEERGVVIRFVIGRRFPLTP